MKKRIEIEAKFELLNVKELLKILERLEKDNNAKLVENKRPFAEWLRTRE